MRKAIKRIKSIKNQGNLVQFIFLSFFLCLLYTLAAFGSFTCTLSVCSAPSSAAVSGGSFSCWTCSWTSVNNPTTASWWFTIYLNFITSCTSGLTMSLNCLMFSFLFSSSLFLLKKTWFAVDLDDTLHEFRKASRKPETQGTPSNSIPLRFNDLKTLEYILRCEKSLPGT